MRFEKLNKTQQEIVNYAFSLEEKMPFFVRKKKLNVRDNSDYQVETIKNIVENNNGTTTIWFNDKLGFDIKEASNLSIGKEIIIFTEVYKPWNIIPLILKTT